jgi:CDP-diacylglycerol--glycerol-3-phosphate 3-phosphatidyltransferase
MDPFCDKVLVLGAFIYLAGPRFVVPQWVQGGDFFTMSTGVYPWMVAVILARELLVTSIRGEVEATGQSFAAKGAGKLKMILQAAVIPIVIFVVVTFKTGDTPWAMWTCHVLIYLTVLVTVWSGVPYVIGAKRTLGGKAGTD